MDPAEIGRAFAELSPQMAAMSLAMRDMNRDNQLLLTEVQELRVAAAPPPPGLAASGDGARAAPAQPTAETAREPSIRLPELFDGDRSRYQTFIHACEMIFDLRPRTYSTDYIRRMQQNLALPSFEMQAIECGKAGLDTWEYKTHNSLMYYPPGVPDNDTIFKKPREVLHKNTRFQRDPFSQALSKTQLQQAAALNAQYKQGKVGPDGKELIPQESPKVGGFGFVATPSPAPGVDESPLMTWGEVESTPFRLDGSETPYLEKAPGPSFKILEPGRRERLGLKMATEAAAKNRAKKQEALRKVTENLASLTPKGLSPSMSPALQRLVNRTSSKYTDKALRASYTPSPAHPRTPGYKTPGGLLNTPTVTPIPRTSSQTPTAPDPTSITDNLLHLPKRRKASDFF